jgi:ubiquinone/menaquinone biosynthesis C-methylase UbiE
MAQNDASFTGSIPQLYDHHMGALLFAPYADDLAKRLSDMTRGEILETAAGTGIVTEALAARLSPAVRITATDLNQPMLDHAATKPGVGRVSFEQADAQALPL